MTLEVEGAGPSGHAAPSADGAGAPLLSVDGIAIRFGGIVALDGISFDIAPGEILGLIGPNGAGKTTLFNCVSRLYTPNEGDIRFRGESVLALAAHQIAGLGITRTFQNLALFRTMTVRDNVLVGSHPQTRSGFLDDALGLRRGEPDRTEIDALIADLELEDVAGRLVADLPTGTQKRVELARALAGRPKLLLLDEPAGGLTHGEVDDLGGLIQRIRDERGVTVLLVEHHMGLVMSISDTVVALDFGRKIAQGTTQEVQNDPDVIRAYLGSSRQ